MGVVQKRTISLPDEQARYIDSQVAKGLYATASEVVRAGLRALRERDEAVRWTDMRTFGAECTRQARLIRDAEGDVGAADDGAWFASSDRTGWTA